MSRYINKKEQIAAKLDADLQALGDDPNLTVEQRLAVRLKQADIRIAKDRRESRTVPLKETITEQLKKLRALREQLETETERLSTAQSRVAEVEKQNNELANELAGQKNHNIQLAAKIRTLSEEKQSAISTEAEIKKQFDTLTADSSKLRFSVATLANMINVSEGYIREVFFKFDQLAPEVFIGLGWTKSKLDTWSAYRKQINGIDHKILIDRLHRSSCCCAQQNPDLRKLPEEEVDFVTAFLTFRGVDVPLEIRTLAAAHQQEWFRKNRVELTFTPPLSHRQITPIAGGQIATWGEDVR
jgi:uncharacterized protein YihD (DUF1040 family)